jgi:hypothetical protein
MRCTSSPLAPMACMSAPILMSAFDCPTVNCAARSFWKLPTVSSTPRPSCCALNRTESKVRAGCRGVVRQVADGQRGMVGECGCFNGCVDERRPHVEDRQSRRLGEADDLRDPRRDGASNAARERGGRQIPEEILHKAAAFALFGVRGDDLLMLRREVLGLAELGLAEQLVELAQWRSPRRWSRHRALEALH